MIILHGDYWFFYIKFLIKFNRLTKIHKFLWKYISYLDLLLLPSADREREKKEMNVAQNK